MFERRAAVGELVEVAVVAEREQRWEDRRVDQVLRHVSGAQCRGARFPGSIWVEARVRETDFTAANLSGAMFQRADVRQSRFIRARLEGADLSYAELAGADFHEARFERTRVCHADADAHRGAGDAAWQGRAGVIGNDAALRAAEAWSARRDANSLHT